MIHSKKYNVTYEYSIKEDVAGIAKIINKTLMLNVPLEGEYKVVVTVKAKAGDLEQTKDAQFMVIKQSDPYEMKSNMVIDKNGVYTIRTYTRQHSIIVQQDLDDVTLVLDNVTIDLSENPNSTGIPIMIKSRSKVNIVLKGTNTLISNKAGCPITLAPSPDDNNTQVKIMGSGRLTVKNPYEGSAIGSIGDGTSTEIVLLEGNINAEAVNGPVFGSQTSFNNCSVFISDKVNLTGFNRSNKYNPVQGVIRTTDFEEYNPAIIVQVKLEGKLPVDSTTIELYCSRPSR